MGTEDASTVSGGIVALGLGVVAREVLGVVGDVQTAIAGTLECSPDARASGRRAHTHIQKRLEGADLLIQLVALHSVLAAGKGSCRWDLTSHLLVALVQLSQALLVAAADAAGSQQAASAQEAGAVCSGVVLEADAQAVARQLGGVCAAQNLVTHDLSCHDLANDGAVGDADHQAVLRRHVLVLGLSHKALAGIVVGLALTTTAKLDLVALEVSLVLDNLGERHLVWMLLLMVG
mmetsp:Transcript_67502/g.119309  ORF Transcript_67502/g.119309 Transcript_67502/m.119309 type:complete len:234 (+) Transcript_67502:635-1336(+)